MRLMPTAIALLLFAAGCPPEPEPRGPPPPMVCTDGVEWPEYADEVLPAYCTWLRSCPDLRHVTQDACLEVYMWRFDNYAPTNRNSNPCNAECIAGDCRNALDDEPVCTDSSMVEDFENPIHACENVSGCLAE